MIRRLEQTAIATIGVIVVASNSLELEEACSRQADMLVGNSPLVASW